MAATPDAVVMQLLRVHLDVLEDANAPGVLHIHSFRDLYPLSTLRTPAAKRALLRAADASGCAGVLLDVLLFLSHTMAPSLFMRELVSMPTALDQWIHYVSEQCVVDHERVSLDTLHDVLALYSTTARFQDLATLLLSLIAKETQPESTLRVARDVAVIVRHYRHRLPAWLHELVTEHIALLELELATEQRDADTAPDVRYKSGYLDKRARGATHLQANWRMRYFELHATELAYYKHDAAKLAQSRNPFLDKRKKGSVTLTPGLQVQALEHNGTLSHRPFCIQIGKGAQALIIDACTPVVQFEWMAALRGNIKRLGLDPVWLAFPRRSVLGDPLAAFVRYCLLYHSSSSSSSSDDSEQCQPQTLRTRFQVDDKRFYFSLLQTLARVGDWQAFHAHTQPAAANPVAALFPSSSSPSSIAAGAAATVRFDPHTIGFGAILDLAVQYHAPRDLVADYDMRYRKHEARAFGKTGAVWSCRTTEDTESAASLEIRTELRRSESDQSLR